MYTKFILIISLSFTLSACNSNGIAKFDEVATGTNTAVDESLNFSGLSSVNGKTDTTVTLNWTPHADAVAYDLFNVASITPVLFSSAWGQASNQIILSGLTPSVTYKFRLKMKGPQGQYDSNTNDWTVTMNAAPDVPSDIDLQSPAYSPAMVIFPSLIMMS